ncbi:hypothetical protein FIBSPDRAFT_962995 [Athelia psychrophila]|uniref:Uncharacterized protein n=1 Tax=Athelia psychrophila TaxID=1759441 RepID=A0A165ZH96_9AGAM|nr:hypothetical protein FIBSPDRAFT_962995 [Fibularhizoctonia sp. CBS 109695]
MSYHGAGPYACIWVTKGNSVMNLLTKIAIPVFFHGADGFTTHSLTRRPDLQASMDKTENIF